MLHHLGWAVASLEKPAPLAGLGGVLMQLAPLPDGRALPIVLVPGPLPGLDEAFRAYEDFAPLHRAVQMALVAESLPRRSVLLLDSQMGAQLVDMEQEDVMIEARGENELTERILPLLSLHELARGSLGTYPRKSPRQRAHELHDWTRVWSARIGAAAGTNREAAQRVFHALHLARLAEQLGITPRRQPGFAEFAEAQRQPHPVRFVEAVFRPLRETFNLLQDATHDQQMAVLHRAHEAGELAGCLRSYAHLSAGKFSADIFAEAFADEQIRLVGWRHMLTHREPAGESDPMRWMAGAPAFDLDALGFPEMLRTFDRITEDLRRLAREQAIARERGERPGLQLDLLGSAPPRLQEEDAPHLALQTGLPVTTTRRDRADAARLVLLAHAAAWHVRLQRPEMIFPVPRVTVRETAAEPTAPPPPPRQPHDPGMN